MARSKTGEAISAARRTRASVRKLREFVSDAERRGDLLEWQRGRAVLGYLQGKRVIELAAELGKTRGALNRWLQWYEAEGVEGLYTKFAPGPAPKLDEPQRRKLAAMIEAGPLVAGYDTGVWTGPMIGESDRREVRSPVPQAPRAAFASSARLLGAATTKAARSSRPRSASVLAQDAVPGDQKKAAACRGVVMFGDEASFWLDGSLHRTWSRVGVQPRVDTFGARKTAHVFGVVTLESRPLFLWRFAPVFNAKTFLEFLRELVRRCRRRKLFLIIDNGPCHNLDADGQAWLRANESRIQLHRLPPYSPEFNPIEGVWKATKKRTTHNRFFHSPTERDAALVSTFRTFQAYPKMISGHTDRFL